MSRAWRHRQYERPAGRGRADMCVVCEDMGWPCEPEIEHRRAERLEAALRDIRDATRKPPINALVLGEHDEAFADRLQSIARLATTPVSDDTEGAG